MLNLKIKDLKPGMILAEPVRNNQGVLLLEAGVRISKKNIRIFKSWGVSEVTIQGNAAEDAGRVGDAETRVKESMEKQLKEKFSDVMDDPVMVEIFNAARHRMIKDPA
jgi:hypothetical protein